MSLLRRNPRSPGLWAAAALARVWQGDRAGAKQVAAEARAAGYGDLMQEPLALLAIAEDSVALARSWMVFDNGSAPRKRDLRRMVDYWIALRDGRFRDAQRMAELAWREPPIADFPGRLTLPAAIGLEAAIDARDTARAARWSDSLTSRFTRWAGQDGELAGGIVRVYALARLGRAAKARQALDALAARHELMTGRGRRTFEFGRAMVLGAEGHPRAGLAALAEAECPVPAYLRPCMMGLARARLLLASADGTGALGVIDTLLRVPILIPDDAVRLHLLRGQALERLGRGAEAAASYREFLRIWKDADPGTPEVEEARAALGRLERAAPRATSEGK
jgi:hypothetical protein